MEKLKVLSLFSGIGAFEKALTRLGVPFDLVGFAEIDKYAIQSYCAIHNVDKSKNLGDVSVVDYTNIGDVDLVVGGSPCQDFSVAGKQNGAVWTCKDCGEQYNPIQQHYTLRKKCIKCGSENLEKTRSSLLVEYLRSIRENKPKYFVYENVKNIIGKQFKDMFNLFEEELKEYGYDVHYKVLNSKHFGIPQNRERVFVIGIRKDLDNKFEFPKEFDNGIRLKDILENNVDEKYYLSENAITRLVNNNEGFHSKVHNENSEGYASTLFASMYKIARGMDLIEQPTNKIIKMGNIYPSGGENGNIYNTDGLSPTLKSGQGVIGNGIGSCNAPKIIESIICEQRCEQRCDEGLRFFNDNCCGTIRTIDAGGDKRVIEKDYKIRKLIPLETWLLMGFNKEDFINAHKSGVSDTQLYKQAGNSIVVNVLEYIFKNLFKQYIEE